MLKSAVLSAVVAAKQAVQDLAVAVRHVQRGAAVFVPGSAPTYPETVTDVSIVFTKFKLTEVDSDRIQASDWLGLLFPETGAPDVNTNDLIRVAEGQIDIASGDYRIIGNDKVMAGNAVALHQLHLRKL